jgi:hypothetical protein
VMHDPDGLPIKQAPHAARGIGATRRCYSASDPQIVDQRRVAGGDRLSTVAVARRIPVVRTEEHESPPGLSTRTISVTAAGYQPDVHHLVR